MDPNNAIGSLKSRGWRELWRRHVSIPTFLYCPAGVVTGRGLTLKVFCCSSGGGGLTVDDGGLSHDDGSHVADWALRRYRLRHTPRLQAQELIPNLPQLHTYRYSSSIRENGSIPWLFLSFVLLFSWYILFVFASTVLLFSDIVKLSVYFLAQTAQHEF